MRACIFFGLILATLGGVLEGTSVRFQSSGAGNNICAAFPSFPCHVVTHQPSAVAAFEISYPHEAETNVQIFETPSLARKTFDEERLSGDLEILGHLEPTEDVGEQGYGYKRIGTAAQDDTSLVEYDFVRSCYLVNLNNAIGVISNPDVRTVKYSRESNEFAVKFARQLDEKLKGAPCPSASEPRQESGITSSNNIPRGMSGSFPIVKFAAIGTGSVLVGLGVAFALWRRARLTSAGFAAATIQKSPDPRSSVKVEPVQLGEDQGSPALPSKPQQVVASNPIDQAVAQKVPATRSRYWHNLLAYGAMVLLLIFGVFELGRKSAAYLSASSELQTKSRMGLRLDRVGSDWRLSWDPQASTILKATKGHLLITDGTSRKFLDLDSADLRGGTIVYRPITNDVVLRLEVDNAGSAETISESVRITASQDDGSHVLNVGSSDRRADGIVDMAARRLTPKAAPNQSPSLAEPKVSAINRSKMLVNANQAGASIMPSNRPMNVPAQPPPLVLPAMESKPDDAILPAVLFSDAPRLNSATGTSHFEPAELVARTNPTYPEAAKRIDAKGTVEVHFHINTEGAVSQVVVVRGNMLLARAAIEAVEKWRYKPARLGGISIETEGSAVVNFQ